MTNKLKRPSPTYQIQLKGSNEWHKISFKFATEIQLHYRDRCQMRYELETRTSFLSISRSEYKL